MNSDIQNPVFLLLIVAAIFAVVVRWYFWMRDGGNYYSKYPIAKTMDELARNGELEGVDIDSAIQSIDPNASKAEQVKEFSSAIAIQKKS